MGLRKNAIKRPCVNAAMCVTKRTSCKQNQGEQTLSHTPSAPRLAPDSLSSLFVLRFLHCFTLDRQSLTLGALASLSPLSLTCPLSNFVTIN